MSEVFVPHTKLRNLSEPKPKLNILSQPNINLNLMFCQNPTPTEAKIKMSFEESIKVGTKVSIKANINASNRASAVLPIGPKKIFIKV